MVRSDRELLEREAELLKMLRWACNIQRPQVTEFAYASAEDVVLRHGRLFSHERAQPRVLRQRAMPKQCFINAYRAAMQFRTLIYCEGYAASEVGFPCLHAWLVDREGRVFDPTWDAALTRSSAGCVYFGLPFNLVWLRQNTAVRKGAGVLSPGFGGVDYRVALPDAALLDLGVPAAETVRV